MKILFGDHDSACSGNVLEHSGACPVSVVVVAIVFIVNSNIATMMNLESENF